MHLDLKESNILINFKKENQFDNDCGTIPIEFKIADFGVSRDITKLSKENERLFVYHRGTPKYMAPE